VEEAARIAVDDAIGHEPAEPQERREAPRRERPEAVLQRAERNPGDDEGKEPADLGGQLAVGKP
jgi:hypothetical protein